MKKSIAIIAAFILAAGLILISCSKESKTPEKAKGYKICLNATTNGSGSTKLVTEDNGKGVTTFDSSEEIFVCNLSDGNKIDASAINPVPDADAHDATIVGDLSGETTSSVAINYAQGNNLRLLYNAPQSGTLDYSAQDGSLAGAVDAAVADGVTITKINGNEITASDANFVNLQSIFKFNFKDGNGDDIEHVRFVRIFSEGGHLQAQYNAVTGSATYGPVTVSRDDNLPDKYVYAGLRFDSDAASDPIVFQVIDADGKVYSGSKNSPSTTGFVNGKFYNATVTVNLYTFTIASGNKKAYFSPGDLGVDNGVYSFTEPFTNWGYNSTNETLAKRVWFNYPEVNYTSIATGHEIYGVKWRIPNCPGANADQKDWNYIVSYRTMNSGVERYYKVTIGSNQYCVLLPPDETVSSDIEADLTSGTVTNYLKYLAKGFVLLMNTNRVLMQNSTPKMKWGSTTVARQGWYWTIRNNNSSSRFYFYWTDSATPVVEWGGNQWRMHARYIRDVE